MIRTVIDTNIIVSGLLWGGLPAAIYDAATQRTFRLVASPFIVGELRDVLHRPKCAKSFAAIQKTLDQVMTEYEDLIELVNPTEVPAISRDPKDDHFLACAVAGEVQFIVSGDQDLLDLKDHANIPIVDVRYFLQVISEQADE